MMSYQTPSSATNTQTRLTHHSFAFAFLSLERAIEVTLHLENGEC